METALVIAYIVLCLGAIAVVLMQSGKSAGISGAIGGGAESMLGKKKGMDEWLSRLTTYLTIAFMLVALGVAILFS